MLAVGGFGPDGVIMENISEQDLVEHCVIVQPGGQLPVDSDQNVGAESVVVTSSSPDPEVSSSGGTRIVYHHSSLHHRLVSHGGQLVTVLTHAPSQHQNQNQNHGHHHHQHHHHQNQHHHHSLEELEDDGEVVEEELVEEGHGGVMVEGSLEDELEDVECRDRDEEGSAGMLSVVRAGNELITEDGLVGVGCGGGGGVGRTISGVSSSGLDHHQSRLVVVTSLPTSAQHTLTLHRIQLKSPSLNLTGTASDHPTVLVTQQQHSQGESPGGQTTAEDLSLSTNHHHHHNLHTHQQQQQQHHHKVNVLTDSHGGQTTLTVIVPPQPGECGEDSDETELGQRHSDSPGVQQHHQQQQESEQQDEQEQQDHTHEHDQQQDQEEGEEDPEDHNLSSPNLSPSSGIGGMIDAAEFRALQGGGGSSHHHHSNSGGQHHSHHHSHHSHHGGEHGGYQSLNGRLSPAGYSPSGASSGQYATLTPLQPLPPISTMTDKFSYGHSSNVGGGFSVMQHNGLGNLQLGVNYSGNYEKLPSMGMSPPHHYSSPTNGLGGLSLPSHQSSSPPSISPQHYSQNGLSPKALSPNNGYESSYNNSRGGGGGGRGGSPSNSPPSSHSLHHSSPSPHGSQQNQQGQGQQQQQQHVTFTTGVSLSSNGLSPHSSSHSSPPLTGATAVVVTHRDASSPPSSSPLSVVMTCGGSGVHPHIAHTQGVNTLVGTHLTLKGSLVSLGGSNGGNNGNNGSNSANVVTTPAGSGGSTASSTTSSGGGGGGELEEINTKELAARISAELKRYSIPQAIFAQRVLCRSQGTLSDLLRNPKPWSKLKSGRETFRRMWKWLQEPEFQRMSALRLAGKQSSTSCGYTSSSSGTTAGSACGMMGPPGASPSSSSSFVSEVHPPHPFDVDNFYTSGSHTACKRKEEQQTPQVEHPPAPKKPRLVFTDLQRRTLQAIFKETKRPSKEMQVTIARQLGLEPTTVGNFFMNARRRSMDKWKEENETSPGGGTVKGQQGSASNNNNNNNNSNTTNSQSSTNASSTNGQQQQQQQLSQHLGSVHVAQVVTVHHHTGLSTSQEDGEAL